jgi:hypothetical protein
MNTFDLKASTSNHLDELKPLIIQVFWKDKSSFYFPFQ